MSTAWARQMRGTYRGTPPAPDRLGTMLTGVLDPPDEQTIVDRTRHFGFIHYERGWIHGVWYCGTKFKPSSYWGQYPGNLLARIQAMFPVERMLHLCSGHAYINGAVNVDLMPTPARDVGADAERLPFADGSFAVVVIDPPYSQQDAERYGVSRLVSSTKVMREARRVLAGGGVSRLARREVSRVPTNRVGSRGLDRHHHRVPTTRSRSLAHAEQAVSAQPFDGWPLDEWQVRHKSDPAVLALADRHYSRRRPGSNQVGPPGRKLVLVTADERAARRSRCGRSSSARPTTPQLRAPARLLTPIDRRT